MDNRELERALISVLDKIDALEQKLDKLEQLIDNESEQPQGDNNQCQCHT